MKSSGETTPHGESDLGYRVRMLLRNQRAMLKFLTYFWGPLQSVIWTKQRFYKGLKLEFTFFSLQEVKQRESQQDGSKHSEKVENITLSITLVADSRFSAEKEASPTQNLIRDFDHQALLKQ